MATTLIILILLSAFIYGIVQIHRRDKAKKAKELKALIIRLISEKNKFVAEIKETKKMPTIAAPPSLLLDRTGCLARDEISPAKQRRLRQRTLRTIRGRRLQRHIVRLAQMDGTRSGIAISHQPKTHLHGFERESQDSVEARHGDTDFP
jgi:hypothetical protein